MPTSDVLAIDIALLLPRSARQLVTRLNATLAAPPQGFRFDKTHLPHVTLAQLFVRRHGLAQVTDAVGQLLHGVPPLALTTAAVRQSRTAATLGLVNTLALTRLHRHVMDVLAPFELARGSPLAFHSEEPAVRQADLDWVSNFRRRSSYACYDPHVTIGIGTSNVVVAPLSFAVTRVAACHLGCFCTCRAVLESWTLTVTT